MTQDETALSDLGARIDDLETAVRDLRHTVSELGRRLAMDLPQVLARHRDAIVDALAPPARSSAPGPHENEVDGSSDQEEVGLAPAADYDAFSNAQTSLERQPPEVAPVAGPGSPAAAERSRRTIRRRRPPGPF